MRLFVPQERHINVIFELIVKKTDHEMNKPENPFQNYDLAKKL